MLSQNIQLESLVQGVERGFNWPPNRLDSRQSRAQCIVGGPAWDTLDLYCLEDIADIETDLSPLPGSSPASIRTTQRRRSLAASPLSAFAL